MGPANQPVSKTTQQEISPDHIPCKHPKFPNAIIGAFKDQRNYLQVSQSIGNISAYHKWQRSLEQIKKSIPSHSLYLPLQCEYEQQGLCGSAGILKLKFDYFPFLLDEQIANRQYNSLPFEQKELWFLLYILVQTAAATHTAGHCVGDIKPKNIFINQTGDVSVYSTFSFPEEFTNFQKVRYFKENNYLPPEGVNDIQTGKEMPSYDEKLGESFSIGLTILDAIFLADHSCLYDQMERFNEIAFIKILDTLSHLHINPILKNILLSMLSMNTDDRLTCIEIYQYLEPYEKQIFQLEEFQIKTELKDRPKTIISQKQQSSNQASPLKNEQKASKKAKRQNLVRYSLSKSDNRNKVEAQSEKMDKNGFDSRIQRQQQNLKQEQSSQKRPQQQASKYSVEASISSTLKRIENSDTIKDQENVTVPRRSFEHIGLEAINVRKSIPNVTEAATKQRTEQTNKETQITFKTGSLFRKQRSSASILQSPGVAKISSLRYESKLFEELKPTTYEYNHSYQGTQFRPSMDLNIASTGSNNNFSDFLKQIDKQIEDSKKQFPDYLK